MVEVGQVEGPDKPGVLGLCDDLKDSEHARQLAELKARQRELLMRDSSIAKAEDVFYYLTRYNAERTHKELAERRHRLQVGEKELDEEEREITGSANQELALIKFKAQLDAQERYLEQRRISVDCQRNIKLLFCMICSKTKIFRSANGRGFLGNAWPNSKDGDPSAKRNLHSSRNFPSSFV
jgi:hypothetical protein